MLDLIILIYFILVVNLVLEKLLDKMQHLQDIYLQNYHKLLNIFILKMISM